MTARTNDRHEDVPAVPRWSLADVTRPALVWAAIWFVLVRIQELTWPGGRAVARLGLLDLVRLPVHPDDGRAAFDSGVYMTIAAHGYRISDQLEAGFPGYALAMRATAALLGIRVVYAGVLLSAMFGLGIAILLWRWLTLVGITDRARWVSWLLVMLWPFAFLFYGVVYADGMVVAAVLATLILAERQRWVLAGIAGALATATRPNAVPIVVVLVVMVLEQSGTVTVAGRRLRWHRGQLRWAHAGVLLSVVGIGSYSLWLWHHAGNPLYWGWLQTHRYGHTPIWHPWAWLKFPAWRPLIGPQEWVHEALSFALLLGALATVPAAARRLGLAYGTFIALAVAESWSGTYNFSPSGRYLLPCLPVLAAVWGPWLAERRGWSITVLVASGVACAGLAAGFASGYPLNW